MCYIVYKYTVYVYIQFLDINIQNLSLFAYTHLSMLTAASI